MESSSRGRPAPGAARAGAGTVWGHDGQAPGYSSWDYTDSTGHRTASVFVTTIFGLATPKTAAATQTLINATVCTMLGKHIPATAATG